ncbi:PREDICTED: pentatricopeptide repeat-containing protein At3g14330 [Fragaria vesca subsp. vesca]|uniref:pentatricopeptide repeat-containing protein At3g14330 n=1 Tax=Fragaria vesca subsp. vesca TaxID=101020 RepID=UPI0002C33D3A|nr:PREDICTED: pentatricopeptide repeat-containing protein At3g14330 [Fragaria vesca subsp. vesca]
MIGAISLSTNITVTCSGSAIPQKPSKPQTPSTLKCLAKSGKLEEAIRLIEASPSKLTATQSDMEAYSLLLHTCISQKSLEHGQRLYLQFLLSKHSLLVNNPTLKSKLITLYSVCGRVDEAQSVFVDGLEHAPESVWVAMCIAYLRNGYLVRALLLYCDMLCRMIWPGNFAFSMALKACAELSELRLGRAVHAQIVKSNEKPDQVVSNALLRLYSDQGCFADALMVFDTMPQRNVVSWNSLIASFVRRDRVVESLECFRRMQGEGMGFTWVTLTTVLPICARMTALYSGKEIHAQIVKSTKRPDVPVLNSLMDMYAKTGAIDYCKRVFDNMHSKDLTSWNTVLTGYAVNGFIEQGMVLFDQMVECGIRPDGVTFIALLSGCSHAGLTDQGRRLFDKMKLGYGISPTVEHYACLVDLLGRAGRIEEAIDVVETMPMKPSGSIWGSILNSCRLKGKVSLAERAATELFELEPNNPGNYVVLSNVYANAGMWEGVNRVRELMKERGLKKEAGCSWLQIGSRIHTFVAGGGFQFRNSAEFKKVWNELTDAMEEVGYIADTSVVLHDVNEEVKSIWVCGHSERVAVTFALVHTAAGMPIRITKNIRICADCHSWVKIVSMVTGRVIVLRDTNRFHHFKGGACTCKDYW